MRFLGRLLIANPTLLFASIGITVVVTAVLAFIWSERRARALAELVEGEILATHQRRRIAVFASLTATALGIAAWWSLFRVHTEPDRVLIAIAVETESVPVHWWQDGRGALELAERLDEQLETVGLTPVTFDAEVGEVLRDVGSDDEVLAAARKLEARWVVRGRVRPDKTIALELANFSDYVMSVELELVDSETGEVAKVPDMPLRVFLWGDDPGDAVALNARYLAERVTIPLIATLAAQPPLLEFTGDRTQMSTEDALRASALERLFQRAERLEQGLELRRRDEAKAAKLEPSNHAALPSTRISGVLAEEYFIGTASDGRVVLLTDPKHITVVPDELGYSVTSEGEALVLADADGHARELLFEHYNFYSAPALSADGRVLWTTVANHGASKSLATIDVATGSFAPVLSHETNYYTSPIPAPDGSRALFYSRPGRYAETSIELVDRDGSGRRTIVPAEEQAGVPDWAHDGRSFYIPVGSWQRIVAVDAETGEWRHLLGQDPKAQPDAELVDSDSPATTSRFSAVSVAHDGRHLYVVEQSLDGREWLGRFDLDAPAHAPDPAAASPDTDGEAIELPRPYVRLAQVEVDRLMASPTGPVVAFESPVFTAPGDPDNRDREILIFGPEPGQLRALTLNEVDDELHGWSRDGRSVFTIQRGLDPGSNRHPVARVYRHDID